jgi:serine/threonine kinase PknH
MGSMNRLLTGGALAVFLAGMAAIVILSATDDGSNSVATTPVATTTAPVQTRPATTTVPTRSQPVKLVGIGAYDPEGDKHENDDLAPLAVDGNASTFWKTEHYTTRFSKTGVGLLLDLGRARQVSRVTVGTDGSGSSARIELGARPDGPFRPVSAEQPLAGTTVFPLAEGAAGRYLVVWVTAIPSATGEAHITEVRATAKPSQ